MVESGAMRVFPGITQLGPIEDYGPDKQTQVLIRSTKFQQWIMVGPFYRYIVILLLCLY